MKEYTVEEVSNALGKSPETVRRLIRTDKIKVPAANSSKEGFKISEAALKEFLSSTPRYMTAAATSLISTPALPIALTGVITAVVAGIITKKNKKVTAQQVENHVKKQLEKNQKIAQENIAKIHELEKKKEKLQAELDHAETEIATYRQALDELDFEQIAKEINDNI